MSARPAAPAIAAAIVGLEVGPHECALDARWLMADAAGLGETDPRAFDTVSASGPLPHPLFAVCYEWPVALALRGRAIDEALAPLSVHATHHLVIHRPPRAGDRLRTTARIVAVAPRPAGTLVTSRFTTIDADGAPVTTTDYGSLYRGVPLVGIDEARSRRPERGASQPDGAPPPAATDARWTETVVVAPSAAHVYTECARIWNPIHTDLAVARGAGLPGLILHGTATLALAVSRVVARDLGGDAAAVREIAVRFTGMVRLPARLTVRVGGGPGGAVRFDAVDDDGARVLTEGVLRP